MDKISFMVAGIASGAGKTTVSCAIVRALSRRGLRVRPYKLGPDFIDAGFLTIASGEPCMNLDRFLLTPAGSEEESCTSVLREEFWRGSDTLDALVVEAVGGLFDDWHDDGTSSADIAKDLGIPVVVVMSGFASCETLGIMTNAILTHDPDLTIAGVIYSMVTSATHFEVICRGVASEHQSRILGYTLYSQEFHVPERHLGLPSAVETSGFDRMATHLACALEESVDVERLLRFRCQRPERKELRAAPPARSCRIAVARDQAFSFYYAFNLDYLQHLGAELVFFSPLSDTGLPGDVHAVYIGGGFPELHLPALAANESMRDELHRRARGGLPVYAECGGLMYLGQEIEEPQTGRWYPGAGLLPIRTRFSTHLHLGYVTSELREDCLLGRTRDRLKGHVFHRAEADLLAPFARPYSMRSFHEDRDGELEGFCYQNTLASFMHLHFRGNPHAATTFVAKARRYGASTTDRAPSGADR